MVAKSQATAAWDRRNCDQVTSERVGAGSIPALLRICQTVDAARRWPSPASSPWMRRYPQVGFSAARRSASRRSSAEVDGRPGGRCGWVQCPGVTMRRRASRCQRSSVSGVTSHPVRLGRGSAAAIAPSKLRSASVSSGRSIWRRSTASWWRNTMISRSFERPERTVSRASDARNRYKIRYTRIQHRPASRQVNDHGRVFGTHTPRQPQRPPQTAPAAQLAMGKHLHHRPGTHPQPAPTHLSRPQRPAQRSRTPPATNRTSPALQSCTPQNAPARTHAPAQRPPGPKPSIPQTRRWIQAKVYEQPMRDR